MTWHRHRYRGRKGHGPPPFVLRAGCAFAALIILGAIGSSTVVSLFFRSPHESFVLGGAAAAIAVILIIGFTFAIRGITHTFREQDRLRRQLMADVAHELRTPLSILQGRIEGLVDGVYPRDDARLGELLDETRHLSRLVEDLRTLANAEAGALELRKEIVEPEELVRDAARSFDRPIKVEVGDLAPIEIDPVRIREVLLNLLANAIRHTPESGEISITAAMQSRRLVVHVRDTGEGIAAEDLPRIFERFQKGRDSHGSGLGLAIARKLVVAHGGQIAIDSVAGKGTTVTISLPA